MQRAVPSPGWLRHLLYESAVCTKFSDDCQLFAPTFSRHDRAVEFVPYSRTWSWSLPLVYLALLRQTSLMNKRVLHGLVVWPRIGAIARRWDLLSWTNESLPHPSPVLTSLGLSTHPLGPSPFPHALHHLAICYQPT